MKKHFGWLLLILLLAAAIRLSAINEIPPGLTHDEADHGMDAWGVVNGIRPIYFTVGYGREPLYDYSTAVLMTFLGPTSLAGRLTSVFFSLIFLAATYAWVRKAFNRQTALLTMAGLAVGFWPLMTSRQSLRSITLVTIMSLTAFFFWQGIYKATKGKKLGPIPAALPYFLTAGIFLGLSFYTYIPSRILWVVFPASLLFLVIVNRKVLVRVWWQVGLMLLFAAVISLPLFHFLANNPESEDRLEQLNTPLLEAQNGNFQPLLENTLSGLQIIAIEGDHQWRYNLPGEPLLSPAMALLFFVGLIIALWSLFGAQKWRKRTAGFFALSWLLAGLSPALVTGPELSTTQAIGLQSVLFIFPALTLDLFLSSRKGNRLTLIVPILFSIILAGTLNDYFNRWADAPQVRVQYETSLATAIDYLNDYDTGTTTKTAAISTTTPDRFHSPAAGELLLRNSAVDLRWFNGQHSLLIPQTRGESTLIFSGFAPLGADLGSYTSGMQIDTILPMRETDEDRPLSVYSVNGSNWLAKNGSLFATEIINPTQATAPVQFGESVQFLGYDLQTPIVKPGEEIKLVTLWKIETALEDGVLFVQLLDGEGQPITQTDRLDVPSYYWVPGDIFLQLHRFTVPDGLPDGRYSLITGLYTRNDEQRLPVMVGGQVAADHLMLPPVEVNREGVTIE